ncbi:unnamed protein product [Moneuplotes crassus]|uniref:Palmitoyltransferase n=1 Tax=Euplotes crassus TaxID=5936 RepID=A0AAD1UPS4_EUPCR|nr:unnamed protein product [Moneuplotes crassus]
MKIASEQSDSETFEKVVVDSDRESNGIITQNHSRTPSDYKTRSKHDTEKIHNEFRDKILIQIDPDKELKDTRKGLYEQTGDGLKNDTNVVCKMPEFKRYQFYEGKSKLWCRGRYITGPRPLATLMTFCLTNFSMIIYYCFVIPKIQDITLLLVVLMISIVVHLMSMIYMCKTATSNPGIIQKMEQDTSHVCAITELRPGNYAFRMKYMGILMKQIHCHTCVLIAPPRSHHCYYCGNCVELFDHHCPWLSCCIGKRNYAYFLAFISLLSAMFVLSLTVSVAMLLTSGIAQNIPSMVVAVYNVCVGAFPVGLTLYHYWLVATGETTYENLKRLYRREQNPFKKSLIQNVRRRICSIRGPNKMVQKYNMFDLKRLQQTSEMKTLAKLRECPDRPLAFRSTKTCPEMSKKNSDKISYTE